LLEREQGASESPAGSSRRNHDHDAASESHV
jgi:hypothetical protein